MADKFKPVIAVHGGAGTIRQENLTEDKEAAIIAALAESLRGGYAVLNGKGHSLDAVQEAVRVLEDSELFNAGRGAVFTHDGVNEHDACIMEGATRNAGAVAAVRRIRNPIDAARMVLDKSSHLLLAGDGAERFVMEQGMELEHDATYFFTEFRWNQLQEVLRKEWESEGAEEITQLDHSDDKEFGTVGAVALDSSGNLAAATSTGGMTNKRYGRIGDTPLVGAGTYADNDTCAVSATGHGEFLMRTVIGHNVATLIKRAGMSLDEAAASAIKELTDLGGLGGLIAVDGKGNIAMPFNSEGMYRGSIDKNGELFVRIYREGCPG